MNQEELEFVVIGYSLNLQFCWDYIYPTNNPNGWPNATRNEKDLLKLFLSAHRLRDCIANNANMKRAESLVVEKAIQYVNSKPFAPKNITRGLDSIGIVERRLYDSVKKLLILYKDNVY